LLILIAIIGQWYVSRFSNKVRAIGQLGITTAILLIGIAVYSLGGQMVLGPLQFSEPVFILLSLVWYYIDLVLLENLYWGGRFGHWYNHRRETIVAWTFLAPMVAYFVFFTFMPLLLLIGISFTEWNLLTPPHWNGLTNIIAIFSSKDNYFYMQVFGRTILYAIAILSLLMVGGFTMAMLLNQNIKLKGVYRTLWYLPGVFSGAVIAMLLRIYLAPSAMGIVNMILFNFGMKNPINWLTSMFWVPIITALFPVWQGIGGVTIFFLAGLQSIDENLYDAAKIDGANGSQLIRYITIPQMVPILLFISVTSGIGAMQMWEIPRIVTAGGPNLVSYTLIWSIQHDAFGNLEMGLGTAQSLVLFVLLLGLIGWQLNNYRKMYGV